MDKELNVKIEEMLKDFNTKNEEMMAKIENLKKSEQTIKDSFLENYKEIEKTMVESLVYCRQLLNTLFMTDKKYIKFSGRAADWSEMTVKSLVDGNDYTSSFYIYFQGSDKVNYSIGFRNASYSSIGSHGWFYFNTTYGIETYQTIAEWYLSGRFTEDLLGLMRFYIKNYLEQQESEINRLQSVLENAQPITKNDTHWSDYIMYLLKWSSEHADKEFAGMSPACYDEWLDNESEE